MRGARSTVACMVDIRVARVTCDLRKDVAQLGHFSTSGPLPGPKHLWLRGPEGSMKQCFRFLWLLRTLVFPKPFSLDTAEPTRPILTK